jgi:hypothetical protein
MSAMIHFSRRTADYLLVVVWADGAIVVLPVGTWSTIDSRFPQKLGRHDDGRTRARNQLWEDLLVVVVVSMDAKT